MNETVLKIMITFFPGIIVTSVLQLFNPRNRKFSNLEFTLYSFVYGMITNLIISTYYKTKLDFSLENLPTENDLFISFGFALFLGIIISFLRNCGLLHCIAFKCHISYEHGFSNALDFLYKSSFSKAKKIRKSYVNVKLLDGTATYYGALVAQEVQATYTEIVLEEVDIFFKNNPRLNKYKQDSVYLQLVPGTFFIEFAYDIPKSNIFLKMFLAYVAAIFVNVIYSKYK